MERKDQLLRRVLMVNAAFTTLCALALLLFSSSVVTFMGVVTPLHLLVLGGVLLFYAVDLGRTAFGQQIPSGRIYYFIAMDVLWVAGSACLLWGIELGFTEAGRWAILLVADVIGLFALLQGIGVRRFDPERRKAASSTS
jgi:hypothetical protein